ncbi:MAG: hypothetical protein RL071_3239 [Pseudomonadota bacterium]|jgi:hypothetical protein
MHRAAALSLSLCACGPDPALLEARAGLQSALAGGQPAVVAQAARAAAAFEGQDRALDLQLAAAFAGPLGRPAEAWPLLVARVEPGDPEGRRLLGHVALRLGGGALIDAARIGGLSPLPPDHPALAWLGARAAEDPAVGWAQAEVAIADCDLLEGEPERGHREIDAPLPADWAARAEAAGARRVVIGRAALDGDPPADTGRGPLPCGRRRLLSAVPDPLPRHLVLGAALPGGDVWLTVQEREGQPWVLVASDPSLARAWLGASPPPR